MPWDAQEDLVMASKRSLGTEKGSMCPVCIFYNRQPSYSSTSPYIQLYSCTTSVQLNMSTLSDGVRIRAKTTN